jgi:sec-independent protein translocase protein TatA
MDLGVPELLIILVLVILLFGVGRIGKIAGELGSGVRAFRDGLRGDEPENVEKPVETPAAKVETVEVPQTGGEKEPVVPVDHRE